MSLFQIDPFAEANGAPPKTLLAFFRWSLAGSGPVLILASLVSVIGGIAEVAAAILLGQVIDAALASDPGAVFTDNSVLLIGCLFFFIVFRPLAMGFNAYAQNIMMQPNIINLILSRIHRYTLGQSVTFFDDDFAGRIAQKEMQTARALNDVVTEVVNTVFFALASVIGAVFLLGTVDLRIAAGLAFWMVGYGLLIRYFMPRIRTTSTARAGARAMVTGQVVDTVTNIKTVKLFAHQGHEDRAALSAMSEYRKRFLDFSAIAVTFRFWLMALAGTLPVLLIGGALWYWSLGLISAGDIAATGAISLRLAQMTGWVSFTLMGLYANVGEVETGCARSPRITRFLTARGHRTLLSRMARCNSMAWASPMVGKMAVSMTSTSPFNRGKSWRSLGLRGPGSRLSCLCCCGSMTPKKVLFASTGRTLRR